MIALHLGSTRCVHQCRVAQNEQKSADSLRALSAAECRPRKLGMEAQPPKRRLEKDGKGWKRVLPKGIL